MHYFFQITAILSQIWMKYKLSQRNGKYQNYMTLTFHHKQQTTKTENMFSVYGTLQKMN